jgi:type II secretory pathway predicted ATPase ExeA
MEQANKQLVELARKIREWQAKGDVSNASLGRRGICSPRLLERVEHRDWDNVNTEKALAALHAAVVIIESQAADERTEEIYGDLSAPAKLKRAFLETMGETGNPRVILLQGDTATGKTSAIRHLAREYGHGRRIIVLEATVAWGDSPNAMLGELLAAIVGRGEIPSSPIERQTLAVGLLKSKRTAVVIDEAHHLGPRTLNTLKTLVNQTPGEFILAAMPTLWSKLELKGWQEVRQLMVNRLSERIQVGLNSKDVEKFLGHNGLTMNGDGKAVLKMLCEQAAEPRLGGNMAFVRGVTRRLLAEDIKEVTVDAMATAIAAEVKVR